jgi:hypothetical protein
MSDAHNLMESITQMDNSLSTGVINILDYTSILDRFIMEEAWKYRSQHLDTLCGSIHGMLIL